MSEEEKEAIKYFENKEFSFTVDCKDYNMNELKKALGMEGNFEDEFIKIQTVLNLVEKLKNKLKKQEKTINKMAEFILEADIDEDICKIQAENGCTDIYRELDCRECIRDFFEKEEIK